MAVGGSDSYNMIFNELLNADTLSTFNLLDAPSSGVEPYLEILEQPKQRGFRFRYPCEGPSHGGLPGEKSKKGKKTYPSVQICNYVGPARIEVTLATSSEPPQPHVHTLVGKTVRQGSYVVEVGPEQHMTATFPNIGIQHVKKKEVKEKLMKRHLEGIYLQREPSESFNDDKLNAMLQTISAEEKTEIENMIDEQTREMNLNVVRLCFRTFLPDNNKQFVNCLAPVYSVEIYDSKAAATSELRICRVDKQAGDVAGNDEVFLLCEKVQKDVEIRFFEDQDGNPWEAFGRFSNADVHRQYAIVFKTPPYWNRGIQKPVTVYFQLRRKSDGETSNIMEFTYKPSEFDPEQLGAKRRKTLSDFSDTFSHVPAPLAVTHNPFDAGIAADNLPSISSFDIHQFLATGGQPSGLSISSLRGIGDLPSSSELSDVTGLSGNNDNQMN